MSKQVSYSKLDTTLKKLGAHIGAAETHGMLTGILSLGKKLPSASDLQTMLLENLDCKKPSTKQWQIFMDAGQDILDQMKDLDFGFNMLLPKDDDELSLRLEAISGWCRGYLSGLGLVGITDQDLKNDTVKEIVQDLSQIAHVSIDTDDTDEDESNYMELVEYVRIAVQNLQLELNDDESEKVLH